VIVSPGLFPFDKLPAGYGVFRRFARLAIWVFSPSGNVEEAPVAAEGQYSTLN